ncbi:MAG: hypothetical protein JST62_03050 [Bacteroidetes bacterium]|nr:hypothetical protein [Bacteroidota bacterium]
MARSSNWWDCRRIESCVARNKPRRQWLRQEWQKINDNGGNTTDYMYGDNGKQISSTSVKVTFSQGGEVSSSFEGYGFRNYNQGTGGALYNAEWDSFSFVTGISELKGLVTGGIYIAKNFNSITGGLKQWIRTGTSYSIEGGFHTYSTRWGAGGNHWKKIGNSTLQNWNKSFRQTKLPGNSWRTQDYGHFHWWKK